MSNCFLYCSQALSYIGSTSRECILYPDQSLNEPAPSSHVIDRNMEMSVIDSVSQQFESELNYISDVTDVRFVWDYGSYLLKRHS